MYHAMFDAFVMSVDDGDDDEGGGSGDSSAGATATAIMMWMTEGMKENFFNFYLVVSIVGVSNVSVYDNDDDDVGNKYADDIADWKDFWR
ncbi:unnamed protein product [Enterobius vermicularis]|uniref:Uncharacterized protein n=1 Tax=Enterobius vermicularis TaxID=51028 RepID=A0A0N4V9H0_ENTVE|nr:unnamed protein product [Enterobius vermicularis]